MQAFAILYPAADGWGRSWRRAVQGVVSSRSETRSPPLILNKGLQQCRPLLFYALQPMAGGGLGSLGCKGASRLVIRNDETRSPPLIQNKGLQQCRPLLFYALKPHQREVLSVTR
jgi:hypothetical protein